MQAIVAARPTRLYVVADGPRNADDTLLCQQARQIVEEYKPECKIIKNYSDENLGLRNRLISGLDWIFGQEERAIIFEDDCLPHPTFFRFCDELLEFYKEDANVMHISGANFLRTRRTISESYYFSKYVHVTGWATWRRAWQKFQEGDEALSKIIIDPHILKTRNERAFWASMWNQLQTNRKEVSWDYQWALTCMARKALCIVPKTNLISNIGFGPEATNVQIITWKANMPVNAMDYPLTHPLQKAWDLSADRITGTVFFHASEQVSYRIKVFFFRVISSIRQGLKATIANV